MPVTGILWNEIKPLVSVSETHTNKQFLFILATDTIKSLLDWTQSKKRVLSNRYTRRISILLLEETSVMKTVELLESESLRLFNDLIVLNKLLGVYMRNSQDEDEVLLVDKWRNGFNQDLDFFPRR